MQFTVRPAKNRWNRDQQFLVPVRTRLREITLTVIVGEKGCFSSQSKYNAKTREYVYTLG